ncbi:TonB-dependent receptor [Paraflavitalea pollutisoli]|uniref:TonB-dependent receptor n=1 Tax=Paraflavitalea pollutisoli TaxID=3034143 RepID=UPI0023EB7351|nr:TonB-dependent receptor [Paraflavitalea sp. H1-2-19X]
MVRALQLLLIVLCTVSSLVLPAQNSAGTKIDLAIQGTSLKEAFVTIQKQSGVNFAYGEDFLRYADTKVTLHKKGITVQAAMDQLLARTPLGYTWVGDQVVISGKKSSPPPAKAAVNNVPKAQALKPATINGQILEEGTDKPLGGATLTVRGTTQTVTTNESGRFTLENLPANAVIVISMVSYEPMELALRAQQNGYTLVPVQRKQLTNVDATPGETIQLVVRLTPANQQLEEAVVIGYGKQRKSLMTSSVGSYKVKDEDVRQVASPTRLLEGRLAGVNVTLGSGNLASGERISIRGISSITAGNTPLYVIDGVPINMASSSLYGFGEDYSPLATLNHADIESIDVLKDAASAAIYGSRASNGVILITTKSGKEGRTNVQLNYTTGFSELPNRNKLKFANSKDWIDAFNDGQSNYNKQYGLSVGDAAYKVPISNPFGDMPDFDWLDLILQKGYFQNIAASMSGGNTKSKYYFGLGYTDQEGVVKTNSIKKYNINVKFNHKFADWLEVGANNMGNYLRNNQVPGPEMGSTIFGRSILQRPFDRPFKPNGDYYVGGTDELRYHNAAQILNEEIAYLDNFRYLGTYYGKVNFTPYLSFKSSYSADLTYTRDYTYYNLIHPYGTGVGRLLDNNRFIQNYLSEQTLNFDKKFNNLTVNALAGYSYQKQTIENTNVDARGFPSPSFAVVSVASEIFTAAGNKSEYALESYFGRGTVSWADKYMLTASLRTDGSSKFGKDQRWGLFPSISFGWNVSKEKFLQQADLDLKLRASYGKTGNQEGIGSYAYLPLISGGQNYGNKSGISASSFGNQDLTWEKADQVDLGFDISLFKRKIDVSFDAYYKKTTDLLYSMPVHATTGMTSIISNIGSLENMGLELTVSGNFRLGPVKWNSSFNIATNKNKVLSLTGDNTALSIGGNRALQVGKDIGVFFLYQAEGLYQYDGEVPQAQYDLGVRAGDVKWTDVDKNGVINDNDRVVVGSSNPKLFGGWNNSFTYKNFQLDILATYVYGQDVYAAYRNITSKMGNVGAQEEFVVNRWTGPGTTNVYPRSIAGETFNTRNSTRFLEDGSFLRLRAISLGYRVPSLKLGSLKLDGMQVYAKVDNLFLVTKYSGWDPDVNNNLDPRFTGVDNMNNPQPRTYSLGVNINFLKQ